MQREFTISTTRHQELIDITGEAIKAVRDSGIKDGFCFVYIPHATAGVILNESADPNIKTDFLNALNRAILEHANYLHDRIDNNASAHIKSAIIGSSATIPIKNGNLQLGTWQAIMFCEFDGPRSSRHIIIKVCEDK
ncbi:secondary thiamine-phosphate synthase enzyme YjbQ [candidate division WOR-3 bacterium]|nr:secondary thiamine-phosphate synthase enzyme YjbQ [candidate division WOR-3 bacterium]